MALIQGEICIFFKTLHFLSHCWPEIKQRFGPKQRPDWFCTNFTLYDCHCSLSSNGSLSRQQKTLSMHGGLTGAGNSSRIMPSGGSSSALYSSITNGANNKNNQACVLHGKIDHTMYQSYLLKLKKKCSLA